MINDQWIEIKKAVKGTRIAQGNGNVVLCLSSFNFSFSVAVTSESLML